LYIPEQFPLLDTVTHIVLGACIGEAIAGKVLGKRAMLLGAIAQTVPDTDFIPQLWLNTTDDLLAHRGFTHSLLFGIIATILLSLIAKKIYNKRPVSRRRWFLLFSVNIFAHIFLDTFNAYGTGWLEPFNDDRLSFHLLYVADPFFSIWPFLAVMILLIRHINWKKRKMIAWSGIGFCIAYIVYAGINKYVVNQALQADLKQKGISAPLGSYLITPSPFNAWLWYIVIKNETGFLVGYRSVFDSKPTDLHYFPQNNFLLSETHNKEETNELLRFAEKFYTVEKRTDTLVLNVLRFGQIAGWYDPREEFVFYYFLDRPGANDLMVQRGRFKRWDRKTFNAFLNRIKGN
jgi:inner membrane protein